MVDQAVHYGELAKALNAICGAGYTKAEIVAEVDDGYSEVVYNCETATGVRAGVDSSFADDRTVDKALQALRADWPGGATWSRCVFRLQPDGTFKFDVGYDD